MPSIVRQTALLYAHEFTEATGDCDIISKRKMPYSVCSADSKVSLVLDLPSVGSVET